MIIINKSSHVYLSKNIITPEKVIKGIVKFSTPEIGKVTGWVTFLDENNSEVTNGLVTEYLQSYFTGEKVDILTALSEDFLVVLSTLNPDLTITVEL